MAADLTQKIAQLAEEGRFPDGEAFSGISRSAAAALTRETGLPLRRIEQAALATGIVPLHYARNMQSLTPTEQSTLLGARVCVVGQGGLGGGVTEILARQGVGALTLIDGDRFEETNLNRQLLCTESGLGGLKAEAGADRVGRINAAVKVTHHAVFLDASNAAGLMAGADVVVDCLDNLRDRFVLEAAAKAAGIPLVSAAVAGTGGHATTIFPEDPGLRLIYGDPGQGAAQRGRSHPGHPALRRHPFGRPGMRRGYQNHPEERRAAPQPASGDGYDGQQLRGFRTQPSLKPRRQPKNS